MTRYKVVIRYTSPSARPAWVTTANFKDALAALNVGAPYAATTSPPNDHWVFTGFTALVKENEFYGQLAGANNPGQYLTFKCEEVKAQAKAAFTAEAAESVQHLTLSNADATNYMITVTMSDSTRQALNDNNYSIYGFKGVRSSQKGKPLVWFSDSHFEANFELSWQENYIAYISTTTDISANAQIKKSTQTDIRLGQQWIVPYAKDTVSGDEGSIEISNTTGRQYACGIGQLSNPGDPGSASPLCAFPLFGTGMVSMVPIQRVVLTFATSITTTGTVIEQAFGPSIQIDLSGVASRELEYDINKGWFPGVTQLPTWAVKLGMGSDFVGPLIVGK